MIAVCMPEYYESLYCGREFAAMMELERIRFERGPVESAIIPLVWQPARNYADQSGYQLEVIPPEIQQRKYIDISRFKLRSRDLANTSGFNSLAQDIACQIEHLATVLFRKKTPAKACGQFQLPRTSAFASFVQVPQVAPVFAVTRRPLADQSDFPRPEAPHSVSGGTVASPRNGRIFTFYSYKGGVGRTMALSNLGRLAARRGRTVLLIDWDLEAPGLHEYFTELHPAEKGLVDYFEAFSKLLDDSSALREELKSDTPAKALERALPLEPFLSRGGPLGVTLLLAGARAEIGTSVYQAKLGAIHWNDLYERHPYAFTAFRDVLAARFDNSMIDSRTGVSDTSGICTAVLPDALVALFAPNMQNRMVLDVVRAALEFRRLSDDVRPLIAYPVASRFDAADVAGLQTSLKGFRDDFADVFKRVYGLEECGLSDYFDEVLLLYVGSYSYGEQHVVDNEDPNYPGSLRRSYGTLLDWLLSGRAPWDVALPQQPSGVSG